MIDVISISGYNYAFSAIKSDSSVVTWGDSRYGGDSSSVQGRLVDVISISGTYYVFAAIKSDGSVVTWGRAGYGGDSSTVQPKLINVTSTSGSGRAFAAITSAPIVTALNVTPEAPSVVLGFTQDFTATETFSDGNAADVTGNSGVTWRSDDDTVATVDSGKATTVATGIATITAEDEDQGVSGSTVLTVTDPVVTGLEIFPDKMSATASQVFDFAGVAALSDGGVLVEE